MVSNFLWGTVQTPYALLTTEMNSLANGTLSAIGPEINNISGAWQVGMLSLHLASAAFVAPSFANVYLVPSTDANGAAYPIFTSAAAAALQNYLAGTMFINGSTAAQNETLPYVRIPLGKFKALILTGGSCPTLGATGNTLNLYPTPSQY